MLYPYLLVVHLLAAIAFIGTLFFEVVIWQTVRRQLPTSAQPSADQALSVRSRKVLHGVVLLLYSAGIGLAWQHRAALSHPLDSNFASLLSLKIVLALSIIGHYVLLAYWLQRGRLSERRARWIRWSILGHMLVIVMLAKAMFYWH
ncbi:CopD family copper resistance protein [Pseudomonas tussilaginis]|uniref:CopD family copper resistance protein n=1 Tax=Pseudomonas sp. 5 TaxID=1619949 RepID=UPI0005EB77D4|nr:membrane protein [Pseudomonas sp. 5]KJJ97587.1 membrane protein [Pseudomonas sp. 5]